MDAISYKVASVARSLELKNCTAFDNYINTYVINQMIIKQREDSEIIR